MTEQWRSLANEVVSPYVRGMSAVIAVALFVFGWDLAVNPDHPGLSNGVFSVVIAIADIQAWGAAFWIASFLYLVTVFSRRFYAFSIATLFGTGIQLLWFGAVVVARYANDAPLTSSGMGLWIAALSATIGTALSPSPLRRETRLVVAPEDRSVTTLKKAS